MADREIQTIHSKKTLSVFSRFKWITSDQNARDVFLPVQSNLSLPVDEFLYCFGCAYDIFVLMDNWECGFLQATAELKQLCME